MSWPYRRGEQHGKSKFTEAQVREIVTEYIRRCPGGKKPYGVVAQLSKEYTYMSRQNIQFICQGKLWPHVTQPLLRAAGLLDPRFALPDCEEVFQGSSKFWDTMNHMARERRLRDRT